MKVTHLYHSGFLVELEHTLLLFDWYKGQLPRWTPKTAVRVRLARSPRPLRPRHLEAVQRASGRSLHPAQKVLIHHGAVLLRVGSHETHLLEGLSIQNPSFHRYRLCLCGGSRGPAVLSCGRSELVALGRREPGLQRLAGQSLSRRAGRIAGARFDCAFLPLDPPAGGGGPLGLCRFLKSCPTAHAFPMHYWGDRAAMLASLPLPQLAPFAGQIVTADVWQSEKGGPSLEL